MYKRIKSLRTFTKRLWPKIPAKVFFLIAFLVRFALGFQMHKNFAKYLKAVRISYLWIKKIRKDFFFYFGNFFHNFYSLCDVAILPGGWLPAQECQSTKLENAENWQQKNPPNFLDPQNWNSDCLEIFGEICVHMATPTKCYFNNLWKIPSADIFGKNLIVDV